MAVPTVCILILEFFTSTFEYEEDLNKKTLAVLLIFQLFPPLADEIKCWVKDHVSTLTHQPVECKQQHRQNAAALLLTVHQHHGPSLL